jgi:hypothetical protein
VPSLKCCPSISHGYQFKMAGPAKMEPDWTQKSFGGQNLFSCWTGAGLPLAAKTLSRRRGPL